MTHVRASSRHHCLGLKESTSYFRCIDQRPCLSCTEKLGEITLRQMITERSFFFFFNLVISLTLRL